MSVSPVFPAPRMQQRIVSVDTGITRAWLRGTDFAWEQTSSDFRVIPRICCFAFEPFFGTEPVLWMDIHRGCWKRV